MSKLPHIQTYIRDGIPEIDVTEVQKHAGEIMLIDVRRADEFNGELGHIRGAKLVTLGPKLQELLETMAHSNDFIVFICRSGNRSGTATLMAKELGLKSVYNMTGGMLRWNELTLPIERD